MEPVSSRILILFLVIGFVIILFLSFPGSVVQCFLQPCPPRLLGLPCVINLEGQERLRLSRNPEERLLDPFILTCFK